MICLRLGQPIKIPRPPTVPRRREITDQHGQSEACRGLLLTRLELLRMLSVVEDMARVFSELPKDMKSRIATMRDKLRLSLSSLERNLKTGHCDVIQPDTWEAVRTEYEGDVANLFTQLDDFSRGLETPFTTPRGTPYWPRGK